MDTAAETRLNAQKIVSKVAAHKAAEATGELEVRGYILEWK